MEAGLVEVAQPSEGTPPKGSPPPSRNELGTPGENRPRRKKRSTGKKKARQTAAEPFNLDVSLPEGHAAAWETIDETDLVARDVSSQRRKGRARTTRSLSDRDQRDLDNAIVMLTHHGVAIERALKASSSLESRVERLETWQTEQIEAEIEDRLEALSSASISPRDHLDGSTDGAMPSHHLQQGWQEAFRDVNDRMGKLTEAFGSYTKNNTRIERLEAVVEGLHDPAVLDGSIDRIATRLGVVEMQLKWSEKQPPVSSKGASRKDLSGSEAIEELSARVDALETVAIGDSSAGTSSMLTDRTRFARSTREHDRSTMAAIIELRKEVANHTKELSELSEAERKAEQHGDALKKSMQTLRADVQKVKQQVSSSRRTGRPHSASTMANNEPTGSHTEQDNSAEQLKARLDAIGADITRLCSVETRLSTLDSRVTTSTAAMEAQLLKLSESYAAFTAQSPSSTEAGLESAILQRFEAQLVEMNERVSALPQVEQSQLEKFEGVSADELQAAISAEVDSLRDELSDLRDETTDLREQLAEIGDSVSVDAPSNSHRTAHAPERPPGRRYSVSLASGAVDDFVAILEVPEISGERDAHDEEAPAAAKSMRVICPEGVAPGDALYVQTPEGDEITTVVPDGVEPGMEFDVALTQDSESVGFRDQRVEARDERDSEGEEQQTPQTESSADVLIEHDDEADTEAGGETDACNATVDRAGPVWMQNHDICMNELQRRVDELDERLTSSELAVDTRLSDMSMLFTEAAAASESENIDKRVAGSNDSELARTVGALVESHEAAALHVEDFGVRFDAFKMWAEASSSSLQSELQSLRKEAAAEATHRSLLKAEVEGVQKVAQELSQAMPTHHTVSSDSTRELEQRVGDQEAIMSSLSELLKESMATLEADRKNVSAIEHSVGTLDDRLVSSTSDLQRRQDDFDVRLRELKQWSEVNSRELTDEVQSLKAVASSVTDLWSQRSESMEMAQQQSEAVQVAMERLRTEFVEAVSKQDSPRPSNMVDAAPTCIMDDPGLTEWMTATTTKVTAVEAGLHENVATLESEFKQFGQILSELSQWMQDRLTNEKTRAEELETRITKLSESIASDTGSHQLVAEGMSKQATTCTQVDELSARLDSLKLQMSDELSSLREDASDLREETSDIREILASTETTVAPLPPLPKTTASSRPASDTNQRRYSVAMAPGAAQEAVASLEGDMNQFEDQLATLRALEASLEQREDRMEHNLEIHREELAKQRLLNEDSAESVRSLERRMEEAMKSDAARAKSILETVRSQMSAMEEKIKAEMGEMVELNMEAEEELRADMAKVIKNAEAAAQAAAQDKDAPSTLMDELTTGCTAGVQDTSMPIDVERLILDQISQIDLVSKSEYRAELQEAKHSLSTEIAEQIKDVYTKFAHSAEESSVLAKRVSQLAEQIELQGTMDAASDSDGGTPAAESTGAVDSVAGSATSKLKSLRRKK